MEVVQARGYLLSNDVASITKAYRTWIEQEIAVSLIYKLFYCNSAFPSVRAKLKVYNRAYVTYEECVSPLRCLSVRKKKTYYVLVVTVTSIFLNYSLKHAI